MTGNDGQLNIQYYLPYTPTTSEPIFIIQSLNLLAERLIISILPKTQLVGETS